MIYLQNIIAVYSNLIWLGCVLWQFDSLTTVTQHCLGEQQIMNKYTLAYTLH